ncbi:MAG: glutathione S-transferase [Xanthobacteraceae bacterium]|nr:glutathione S-transferase [Xanthobacteraceae bacterium]QYK45837.1 MAG: glutathione S-transferase [Xanthobacteraceae bacterium]HMN51308.1 glutathione S-transferase [Xanthobacteraceae bacterium]
MKLYDMSRAPNPRRVRIFLAEKGIDVPKQEVDLGGLEQFGEAFTAKNPMQRVPVLELDDGTFISESVAICLYFEKLHPEPNLFGKDALESALVEMWNRRLELHFYGPVSQSFRHGSPAMAQREKPQVPDWATACRDKAADFVGFLDSELGKREYVAGNRFTVADITALCTVDFMRVIKLSITPEMKNLARWHASVSSRPSAKA